jgi:hypothetical protein
MVTAKNLGKSRDMGEISQMLTSMGTYDHKLQRRWVGQDASLIEWSLKSDTAFDGESKDPD